MTYINHAVLTADLAGSIAQTIYEPSHIGVVAVPDALTKVGEELLLNVCKEEQRSFKQAPHIENITHQEMNQFYIESGRFERNDALEKVLCEVRDEYSQFYETLAQHASFNSSQINSIGVHGYANDSIGIGPHRDYSQDQNAISIFVLQNEAPFYAGFTREETDVSISAPPRSLILVRAPRERSENNLRPFHAVKGVDQERYSVLLRHRVKQ